MEDCFKSVLFTISIKETNTDCFPVTFKPLHDLNHKAGAVVSL